MEKNTGVREQLWDVSTVLAVRGTLSQLLSRLFGFTGDTGLLKHNSALLLTYPRHECVSCLLPQVVVQVPH